MTKEMTPMKRLSTSINDFKGTIKPYFREVNLNKSESKYNPYAWRDDNKSYSKGVESDFIMIFTPDRMQQSFAIAFTFLNLPLEQQRVQITIKKGESNSSIVSSGEITVEEFKIKLKEINKQLKENSFIKDIDSASIIGKVSEIFLNEPYDLKGEIKEAAKAVAKLREQKRKEYKIEQLEDNVVNTTNSYDNAEKKSEKAIKASKEQEEVKKLEELLTNAKKKLNEKTIEIKIKYQLTDLKEEKDTAKIELQQTTEIMNKEVQKEIDKLPTIVKRKMK